MRLGDMAQGSPFAWLKPRRPAGDLVPRADAAMRAREWAVAAALYNEFLAQRPERADIWVQFGHALKEQQRIGEAEVAYRQAVSRAPGDHDAPLHLGHMLLGAGARLAALAALRHAARCGSEEARSVADDIEARLDDGDGVSRQPPAGAPAVDVLRVAGRVFGPEGAVISGWVLDVEDVTRSVPVVLLGPDGAEIARTQTAPTPGAPVLAGAWRLPIPPALLDGMPRALTVVLADGTVLPGGRIAFRLGTGGACFLSDDGTRIEGWTESGLPVRVTFDGAESVEVLPNGSVENLAVRSARRFRLPLSAALLDGKPHQAEVCTIHRDQPLPGSPIHFCLMPSPPGIVLHTHVGHMLAGAVENADGTPATAQLAVAFDGGVPVPLATDRPRVDGAGARRWNEFRIVTPPDARSIIFHRLDGHGAGPIASFALEAPLQSAPQSQVAGPAEVVPDDDARSGVFDRLIANVAMTAADGSTIAADAATARAVAVAEPIDDDVAPLISIIMPTYNRAYTIAEAIQSVLDQCYQRWELLIADDESTDRTEEVVRTFEDPRIRYFAFRKSNGAGARNKALRFARGALIAYLDSDNIWSPWYLSVIVRRFRTGCLAVHCGFADVTIDGVTPRLEALRRPEYHPIRMHERNQIDLNSYVHHRALYDWLGGFDGNLPRLQDWDMILRHASLFPPLPEPRILTLYRRNIGWGQVTRLFAQANTRGTVMEKSGRRVRESHARVVVNMDRAADIGLLIGTRAGSAVLAAAVRRMMEPVAYVTEHYLEAPDMATDREWLGALPPRLLGDPAVAGQLLATTAGHDAIVAVGIDAGFTALLARDSGLPVWSLDIDDTGLLLRRADGGSTAWPIGSLALKQADALADLAETDRDADPLAVFLSPRWKSGPSAEALDIALRKSGIRRAVLIPSNPLADDWTWIDTAGSPTALQATRGWRIVRQLADIVIAPCGVAELDPAAFALMAELMGNGAVPVVPASRYWRPFLEMRAAHRMRNPAVDDLVGRLRSLRADADIFAVFRQRAREAHDVVLHPELTQERLRAFAAMAATEARA